MNTFLMQALCNLQVGDRVKITYQEDDETIKVQGTVEGTDNQSSMAVQPDDLNEDPHYLSFESVRTFRKIQASEDKTPTTNSGGQGTTSLGSNGTHDTVNTTETSRGNLGPNDPPFTPPVIIKERDLPLHKQNPTVLTLNYTEQQMKNFFDNLSKSEKKLAQSPYNSFVNQARQKNKDLQFMYTKAQQLSDQIYNDYQRGTLWSSFALRLCGGMFYWSRNAFPVDKDSKCYDKYLFVYQDMELYPEAAVYAYIMKDYHRAGAFAAIALRDAVPEIERDLLIILARSIFETKDLSVLPFVKEQLPKRYDSLVGPIIQELLAEYGVSFQPPYTLSCEKMISMLATQYEGKAVLSPEDGSMLDIVQYYLGVDTENESTDNTPGIDEEATVPPIPEPELPAYMGWISRLDWSKSEGNITTENEVYSFRYHHIEDDNLASRVQRCYSSELDGATCWVLFDLVNGKVRNIISTESPIRAALRCMQNREPRDAVEACLRAVGSPDYPEALARAMEYAVQVHRKDPNFYSLLVTVERAYAEDYDSYPRTARSLSFLAQAYHALGDHRKSIEFMNQALSFRDIRATMRSTFLFYDALYCQELLNEEMDEAICLQCIENANEWISLSKLLESTVDASILRKNYPQMLNCKCQAEILLNRLSAAEEDLQLLNELPDVTEELAHEIFLRQRDLAELRTRVTQEGIEDKTPVIPITEPESAGSMDDEPDNLAVSQTPASSSSIEDFGPAFFADIEDEIDDGADIVPYDDRDGWPALHLSDEDVIHYALSIQGDQALPYSLTYLRAAAKLNPNIRPFYELLAVAANDPSHASDYSVAGLFNMLDAVGADYQELSDYCMSAAFLRTSFQADRGYDYSARAVRESISPLQTNETLRAICDVLEEFRSDAKAAMDIYADYRKQDVKLLQEAQNALVRKAIDLNAKYIQTPPRDSLINVSQTKQIIFSKSGFFAKMLRAIINNDRNTLDSAKGEFAEKFLTSSDQISDKYISTAKIDDLIADGWEQAGREMHGSRISGTLQGERRNNLRSNIKDILKVICQWYELSEQGAGLTSRNEEGEATYNRCKPRMVALLEDLQQFCEAELASGGAGQASLGLHALAHTAKELRERLTGEWVFGNEKYMFVDFLKRDEIILDKDFIPDVSSTFCALTRFNILARLRAHIEGDKPTFENRITQIYSPERFRKGANYGSAEQIVEYLTATRKLGSIELPDNADQYLSQTEQQAQIRYRSFMENYALAVNFGQIMQSDVFCYTLEDTARYWYHQAKVNHNYGFFNAILQESTAQIHSSAQQYESLLNDQLDAMIANNQTAFDQNPGYENAIREQISQQNFIVAEDWMNRVRAHDFSLDLEQPEALSILDRFWFHYGYTYGDVCAPELTLEQALVEKKHGFVNTLAPQLIHAWVGETKHMSPGQITRLLNLLGWSDISVEDQPFNGAPGAEIYFVKQDAKAISKTAPVHPIAAFGSELATNGMSVVCLYGNYTADSLYEQIRVLDKLNTNKLLLVDCAISGADRHALAQMLKRKESGLQNVYLLLDRVALCFLADNYTEGQNNRNLMAIGIPFSYCMPFVVASVFTMPPEIFIGRKHELNEVESPTGVNLIYGGRQLGKSALLKKALGDINFDQGRRAILEDINTCDCAASALKLSSKLAHEQILTPEDVTEDWGQLCNSLISAMRAKPEIKYLLIMLDEADCFIEDCGQRNYLPIVKLKDVQQELGERFKFVLAGLHNIVRFNQQVALGNNSVITHMPHMKVTPFKAPEAEELLRMPLSFLGMSLPSKVTVSQILATVNYFPGLIQLYAQNLVESLRAVDYAGYDQRMTPPYVITDDHLRRVMADKEFVKAIKEKFFATLTLDQKQGSCYYPIGLLFGWMYYEEPQKAKQAGFSADDVIAHAKVFSIKQIMSLDRDQVCTLLSELEDLNILRSVSAETYLLASKNFRDLLGSYEEIFEKLTIVGEEQI